MSMEFIKVLKTYVKNLVEQIGRKRHKNAFDEFLADDNKKGQGQ